MSRKAHELVLRAGERKKIMIVTALVIATSLVCYVANEIWQ
ncbi:MAG: hypothetical protein WAW79_01310 [Steroidobacteraceae bacterium]